jgi:hypothetical protein
MTRILPLEYGRDKKKVSYQFAGSSWHLATQSIGASHANGARRRSGARESV